MSKSEKKLFDDSPQSPGDHLRQLLAEKGWTQDELAAITGRSRQQLNGIIAGRSGITPEMAVALGAAFGKSPGYWLAIESAYRLAALKEPQDAIMERARLYDLAPIKDMQKRGWLPAAKDQSELPEHLKRFFETDSLDKPIEFPLDARKAAPLDGLSPSQRAWCFRARHLAKNLVVKQFDRSKLQSAQKKPGKLAAYRNEAVHAAEVLSEFRYSFCCGRTTPWRKDRRRGILVGRSVAGNCRVSTI